VAHLIELCTLVYPQRYGPELADEVKKWGQWVLKRIKAEIGDLYPKIQIPNLKSPNRQFNWAWRAWSNLSGIWMLAIGH